MRVRKEAGPRQGSPPALGGRSLRPLSPFPSLSFCHLLWETTTADQMGDGKGVALVASRILLLSLSLSLLTQLIQSQPQPIQSWPIQSEMAKVAPSSLSLSHSLPISLSSSLSPIEITRHASRQTNIPKKSWSGLPP